MAEIQPIQRPFPEAALISSIIRGMFPDHYPSRNIVLGCQSPSSLTIELPYLRSNATDQPLIITPSASSLGLDAILLALEKSLARLRYTIRSTIHLSLEEIVYQQNFTPTLSTLKTFIISSCLYPLLSSLSSHLLQILHFPYSKIPLLISYLESLFRSYWFGRIRPIYQRFLSSLTVELVKASNMEGVKWHDNSVAKERHINDVQILVLSTVVEDGIREKVVRVVRGVVERHFERERKLKATIVEMLGRLKKERKERREERHGRAVEV